MSLTTAAGPLARHPAKSNYRIDSPAHRLFLHPFPRRVRAELAGETVLDSRSAFLLYETGLLPRVYVPLQDVRQDVLRATDTHSHCPFKGDASYWSIQVGTTTADDALWTYLEPKPESAWLRGLVGVYHERLDRWLDEDEEVRPHLRDPFHRVDARRSTRHVRVLAHGELVAETRRPVVVSETGLPNRWYVPREDVLAGLQPSATVADCPYKGHATYWSLDGVPDACWSYEEPLGEALAARGHVSFAGDDVVVEVDGERVAA
ncbi:MAG TPA: DUF427 domain-containing protein [Baekduia sp.]|nr:DUF427 domain-containing protein [Baekduia sp.]